MVPDKKILVVCEGPSDFALIEGIINHAGKQSGLNFQAELLKPQLDATSRRHEKFGYEGVKSWCKSNRYLKDSFGRDRIGSIMTIARADYLLVHVDTDIAESLKINGRLFEQHARREWCEINLNNWLGAAKPHLHCHFLLPSYQIETWILATHNLANTDPDYELLAEVEERLLELGYKKDNTKVNRIYKELQLYKTHPQYLPRVLAELTQAKNKCQELDDFLTFIDNM